ncbi:MAG: sugar phosphate isomerase/epimerase [Candidatus Omnitrophota bacterium]
MPLALSTSWNAYRTESSGDMLFEIKQLGFDSVELSFNLSPEMVDAACDYAAKNGINITSLHNFCPVPDGLDRRRVMPDHYSLSSLNEKERLQAVGFTRRSIDAAVRLGAGALVLHCGRVDITDHTRRLIDMYNLGLKGSFEFMQLKEKMSSERSSVSREYLSQALSSLKELNLYAAGKGIKLGLETRFYYCEIPSIEEIGIIFDEIKGSQLYYWHDTGHAQLMENLGFLKHNDFLERYGQRMAGAHIHGIAGCCDHLAPSSGGVDFSMLKPYLKEDSLKVIEAHHPATAEELRRSRAAIEELYG